jgi:hypothetical protein
MAIMPTITQDANRQQPIDVWTDTARSGVVIDVDQETSPRQRNGVLSWLLYGEWLTTVLPFVVTVAIIGMELFLIGVIGPKVISNAILSVLSIPEISSLIFLPVIGFVAFAMMGGRRFDGGALGGVFGFLVGGAVKLLRLLVPYRAIYRSVQRVMNDAIIGPARQNRSRDVPTHIIRLQRAAATSSPQHRREALSAMLSGRPPEAGTQQVNAQVVDVHLRGHLQGAAIRRSQPAVFYGRMLSNGVFLADYGIDQESGARIEGRQPRGPGGRP